MVWMRHAVPIALAAVLLSGAALAGEPAALSPAPSAWLGIVFGDALDGGVQVVAVVPGGPADRSGLREGDVLLAVGASATPDRAALQDVVRKLRPDEDVVVRLIRDGRISQAAVRPAEARRRERPPFELMVPESPWAIARAEAGRAPFSGFESAPIPRELRVHYGAPAEAGVLVTRVDDGGPAARGGLRVGDVVVKAAGRPVEDAGDLGRALARPDGGPLALDVVRARKSLVVRIERAPAAPAAREAERVRLEAERDRLRREIERLEAEIEKLRRPER